MFAGSIQTSRKPGDPRRSCGVHAKSSSTERVPGSSCFGEGRIGGRHGDLRFWCALGGCESVVARRVDHQRALAACTTERSVLFGKRSKRSCCLERCKSAFPRHLVVLGADCNVRLHGFEDGRFVGNATVPLTKARSCADAERASAGFARTIRGLSGIA